MEALRVYRGLPKYDWLVGWSLASLGGAVAKVQDKSSEGQGSEAEPAWVVMYSAGDSGCRINGSRLLLPDSVL